MKVSKLKLPKDTHLSQGLNDNGQHYTLDDTFEDAQMERLDEELEELENQSMIYRILQEDAQLNS